MNDTLVLIAYNTLESSVGSYLEWMGNGLDVTTNTWNTRMHFY